MKAKDAKKSTNTHSKNETTLVLVDIRSAHNVGSVFRTADAAGVSKIFLTGYTPAPVDQFGRERGDISKVALGAEKTVAWEHIKNPQNVLKKLREQGIEVVAVEQDARSIDYKKFKSRKSKKTAAKNGSNTTAFVFGNETKGLPKKVLEQCDQVIEIPMKGTKESLNVSVSVGIVLFR